MFVSSHALACTSASFLPAIEGRTKMNQESKARAVAMVEGKDKEGGAMRFRGGKSETLREKTKNKLGDIEMNGTSISCTKHCSFF